MSELANLSATMETGIKDLLHGAWRVVANSPRQAGFFLSSMGHQGRAARLRERHERAGLHVPPFLIVSLTNQCNLRCAGCYSAAQHRSTQGELTAERFRSLLTECGELGVSFALLAGGEPLMRPDLLEVAADFPSMLFPVFTNGTLLDPQRGSLFRDHRNLIPIVSLEGDRTATDARRGPGVFDATMLALGELKRGGCFAGTSITVTSANLRAVTDPAFITQLTDVGCKLVFYVEYVPADGATQDLALSELERRELMRALAELRRKHPAVFVAFPGDEEAVGGCLAAGRGFVHIGARGEVEPCPFTPWSDTSLVGSTLREALASPLLVAIREHHDELKETSGGCALWAKREWVQGLLLRREA